MKILINILLLLLCFKNSYAQELSMDVNLEGFSSFGSVRINDRKEILSKTVSNINYSDAAGSVYWDTDWNTAILYTSDFNIIIPEVKLNLLINEILYKEQSGQVFSVNSGVVKKIIFFKGNDTTTIDFNERYSMNLFSLCNRTKH